MGAFLLVNLIEALTFAAGFLGAMAWLGHLEIVLGDAQGTPQVIEAFVLAAALVCLAWSLACRFVPATSALGRLLARNRLPLHVIVLVALALFQSFFHVLFVLPALCWEFALADIFFGPYGLLYYVPVVVLGVLLIACALNVADLAPRSGLVGLVFLASAIPWAGAAAAIPKDLAVYALDYWLALVFLGASTALFLNARRGAEAGKHGAAFILVMAGTLVPFLILNVALFVVAASGRPFRGAAHLPDASVPGRLICQIIPLFLIGLGVFVYLRSKRTN